MNIKEKIENKLKELIELGEWEITANKLILNYSYFSHAIIPIILDSLPKEWEEESTAGRDFDNGWNNCLSEIKSMLKGEK